MRLDFLKYHETESEHRGSDGADVGDAVVGAGVGRGTAVWVYHAVGAAVDAVVGASVGKIVGASEIVGTGEIVGAVEYGGQWGIESKSSCQGRHRLNLEAPSNIRLMYITFDVSQLPMSELKAVAR